MSRGRSTSKQSRPATGRFVRKDGARAPAPKARKTITLDEDVLHELESREGSVSAQINEFVKQGLDWERRQAQIMELVAEYEAEFGVISDSAVAEWERRLA